jgi:hypothetical protein
MSITYSTALNQLRENLNEARESTWRDTELLRYLYHGARRIAQRVLAHEKEASIAVTLGVQSYTAPVDMILAHRLVFAPASSTQRFPLELREVNEMDEIWGTGETQGRGDPRYVSFWGKAPSTSMKLYPVPTRSGTITIQYYNFPTLPASFALTALSSTVIDIPDGWEDLVVTYAEARARFRVGDQHAVSRMQDFEAELANLDEHATLSHHDQPGHIVADMMGMSGNPMWGWNTSY